MFFWAWVGFQQRTHNKTPAFGGGGLQSNSDSFEFESWKLLGCLAEGVHNILGTWAHLLTKHSRSALAVRPPLPGRGGLPPQHHLQAGAPGHRPTDYWSHPVGFAWADVRWGIPVFSVLRRQYCPGLDCFWTLRVEGNVTCIQAGRRF